jgi:hypothetical protein
MACRLWVKSRHMQCNLALLFVVPEVLFSSNGGYEGKGVPVDIKLLNKKSDIENGVDPLIICALKVLKSKKRGGGE